MYTVSPTVFEILTHLARKYSSTTVYRATRAQYTVVVPHPCLTPLEIAEERTAIST